MQSMTKAHLAEFPNDTFRCACCEQELNPKTLVWLELSFKTGEYAKPGEVPEDESQGCFTFGRACARRALKKG
jgi:hypothetical protein